MKNSIFTLFIAVFLLISSGFEAKAQTVSSVISNFLGEYSWSLLYGTFQDHANLFANPVYFEGKNYNSSGITKVAKNFYSNYQTIAHRFEIVLTDYDQNKNEIMIMAVEYQTIKNRKTGVVSSTHDLKQIHLINQYGWKCSSKYHGSLY